MKKIAKKLSVLFEKSEASQVSILAWGPRFNCTEQLTVFLCLDR